MLFFTYWISFLVHLAQAQSLDTWMEKAKQDSEAYRAYQFNLQSVQAEIRARDIVLSGQLTLQAENFNNDQDAVAFARRARSRFVDLIYDQPFSTGTLLSMTTGHDRAQFDNFGLRHTADWEVRLTQSLWRDFLGRMTSYRREGERAELLSRSANILLSQQQWLMTMEQLYWDFLLAKKEEQIRIKNLQSSKELLQWTNDRRKRSAAELSDLLQVKALVSSRELDLVSVKNQLDSLLNECKVVLPQCTATEIPAALDEIMTPRSLQKLLVSDGSLKTPTRLDQISALQLAQQAEAQTKAVREQQKPTFDVYMSYGQNGISDTFNQAWDRASNDRYSGTRVGFTIRAPLNRHLASEQERAARLNAEALRLTASTQQRASELTWNELERKVDVLKKQVQEAERLSQCQTQKVQEERRRYRLGRSTVFQLVTFEMEAAEAEVRKYRFLADLRKMESEARLFTKSEALL